MRHDDEMEPSVSRFFSTDPWGNRLEFVVARSDDDLAGALLRSEERLLDPSFRASSEVAAWLDPEFVEIGRSGRIYDRAETLAALAAESTTRPSPERAIRDFTVSRLSPSFARVTYRIETREGDSVRASIWRRTATGAWQLVFHQGTPLGEAP